MPVSSAFASKLGISTAAPPSTATGSIGSGVDQWNDIIESVGNEYPSIDKNLVRSVIHQESRGNPGATSPMTRHGTAKGLGQFIDPTAKAFIPEWKSPEDSYNPEKNIRGIYAYMEHLINKNNGDVKAAVSDYFGHGSDVTGMTTDRYADEVTSRISMPRKGNLSEGFLQKLGLLGQQSAGEAVQAVQSEQPIVETPMLPEEEKIGIGSGMASSAVAGLAGMTKGFYSMPAGVAGLLLLPVNAINKGINRVVGHQLFDENVKVPKALTDNYFTRTAGKVEEEQSQRASQRFEPGTNALKLISEGNIGKLAEYVGQKTLQAAPNTLGLAGLMLAGVPQVTSLTLMGATTAGAKEVENKPKVEAGEVSQLQSSLSSSLNGVFEASGEAVGTAKVVDGLKVAFTGLSKSIGGEAAKETIRRTAQRVAAGFLKGAKQEVPSEVVTQFSQDLTDWATGVSPDMTPEKMVQNMVDAGLTAMPLSGTMGGATGAVKSAEIRKQQKQVSETYQKGIKKVSPEFQKAISGGVTPVTTVPEKPEIPGTIPGKKSGELTGQLAVKSLVDFGTDAVAFEKLPIEEQNKIFSQLSPDEQDKVLFGEEITTATIEDIRKRVEETERAPEEKEEIARVELEPSDAQKSAGNYPKGHINKAGFAISIENPAGSTRKGKDSSGKEWETPINHDYGYIRGTKGADAWRSKGRKGDQLDVFINPGVDVENLPVFIVNQVDPKTQRFDEHKVMVGFSSKDEAEKAYLSNYEKGWQGLGSIYEMPMEQFKEWAYSEETKYPFKPDREAPPEAEEVPAAQEDMKRGEELAAQIPGVKFRGISGGTTRAGKTETGQLMQFDDEVSKSTKAIKVTEGIDELEKTINEARKGIEVQPQPKGEGYAERKTPEEETEAETGKKVEKMMRMEGKQAAHPLKDVGGRGLHLIKAPSGVFAFSGTVPNDLYFEKGYTEEQIKNAKQFGERFGPKKKIYRSIEEAKYAAEELGFKINSLPKEEEKNDQKNIPGVPSEERIGKEPVQAGPVERPSGEEASGGGILQKTPEKITEENREFNEKQKRLERLAKRTERGGRTGLGPRREAAVRRAAPHEHYDNEYHQKRYAHKLNTEFYNALRFGWKKNDGSSREGSQPGWVDDYNIVADRNIMGGTKNPTLSKNATEYLQDVADRINESPQLLEELDRIGVRRPDNADDIREIISGSYTAPEFVGYHNAYERKVSERIGSEHKSDALNKALAVFSHSPKRVTPEMRTLLEDYFQAPLEQVTADYDLEEVPATEGPAPEKTTRELKPDEWKQQDIFGKEKSQKEIEAEEEKRQQRAEVKRRMEQRRGGEADISNLPLFEDADIEGSQATLKFAKGIDQTKTPEFKKWFGDSKVVDESGRPKIISGFYVKFDKNIDPEPNKWLKKFYKDGVKLKGKYNSFKDIPYDEIDEDIYRGYPEEVVAQIEFLKAGFYGYDIPSFVFAERAGNFTEGYGVSRNYRDDFSENGLSVLGKLGENGVEYKGHSGFMVFGGGNKMTKYYVGGFLNPNTTGSDGENLILMPINLGKVGAQIKSATSNRGTFDTENPDIRFANGEKPTSVKRRKPAYTYGNKTEERLTTLLFRSHEKEPAPGSIGVVEPEKGVSGAVDIERTIPESVYNRAVKMSLEKALSILPKGTKSKIKLSIVNEIEWRGKKVRFGIDETGSSRNAAMFWDKKSDTIHLWLSKDLTSKEIAKSIMHELPGHFGSRLVYASNPDIYGKMQTIFISEKNHGKVVELEKKYAEELKNTPSEKMRDDLLFDEWTASKITDYLSNRKEGVASKIYGYLRYALTRIGILKENIDDVLRSMVKQMRIIDNTSNNNRLSFSKGKLPVIPKRISVPAPEQVAEAKAQVPEAVARAKFLEKEMRSLRRELKGLQENLLMARAEIGIKLKEAAEVRIDEVKNAIYDYAKAIGLSGVPYNKVDLLLKNATTSKGLLRAVERLDKIWESYEKRAVYTEVLTKVENEYRRLAKIASGKIKSTIPAEYNNRLKNFLDSLKTKPNWFEGADYYDMVDKMTTYFNLYADKDMKRAASAGDLSKDIQDWMHNPEGQIPEHLKNLIQAMFQPSLSTMTAKQLRAVADTIDNIKEWGKTEQEIKDEQHREALEKVAVDVAEKIRAATKDEAVPDVIKAEKKGRHKQFEFLGKLANEFTWSVIDNERMTEWLAAWKEKDYEKIKEMVQYKIYVAEENYQKGLEGAEAAFKDIHEKINWVDALKKVVAKIDLKAIYERHGVEYRSGEKNRFSPITLNNMMHTYAHSKNPGNLAHLRGLFKIVVKDPVTGQRVVDYGLSQKIADDYIEETVKAMPEDIKTVVDNMHKYYDEVQYDRLNEAFEREMRIAMPKEENYFPIDNIDTDRASASVVADAVSRQAFKIANVQKGFVRMRVHSNAPFFKKSYFHTVANNLKNVERYIAYNEAIREVNEFINHPEVKDAIEGKSKQVYEEMKNWIADVAHGKASSKAIWIDKFIDYVIPNFTTYALGLKMTTGFKQWDSMAKGMRMIKKFYVAKSVFAFMAHPIASTKYADGKSATLRSREKNIEREITELANKSLIKEFSSDLPLNLKNAYRWIRQNVSLRDIVLWHIKKQDKIVCTILWNAKYNEQMEEHGNEMLARQKADEVIRKTQSRGGILFMPSLYRQRGIIKALTVFTSDVNQNVNIAMEMAGKWGMQKSGQNVHDVFWNVFVPATFMWMINNAFQPLVAGTKAVGGDDEPQDWRFEELIREMVGLYTGSFPFIGQFMDAVAALAINNIKDVRGIIPDKRIDKYIGDLLPAGIEALERMVKGIQEGQWANELEAILMATGIPWGNVKGLGKGGKAIAEEGAGKWRSLFWSDVKLREETVYESMARRYWGKRINLKKRDEEFEKYSEWYAGLDEKEKGIFDNYASKWYDRNYIKNDE